MPKWEDGYLAEKNSFKFRNDLQFCNFLQRHQLNIYSLQETHVKSGEIMTKRGRLHRPNHDESTQFTQPPQPIEIMAEWFSLWYSVRTCR